MNTNLALKFEPDFTEAAEDFGKGNVIQSIKDDYTQIGLIGEDHNKLMCYLAAVSRKMDNPLNILVLSSSGAGKSTLQDKTIKLTPPEDVIRTSSISNKALFYMDSLKGKLLALEEAAGMNDTYAVRTLISEGYLSLETVSGGKLKSTRVEGGCSIFQTTTNPEINAETKSRFFTLGVDESRKQTRNILASQRKSYTLEGLIGNQEEQSIIYKHHTFQRMLKPYAVVNPYAEYLFYDDDRLQARRDQPKLLSLCCVVAFLNQLQKDVKSYQGIEYIEASKEDINIAVELASEIIGMSLDNLSIPARNLLEQLNEMLPTGKERHSSSFTRTDIMNYTGWTSTRLHIHLKELINMELVVKLSGTKNSLQHYKLLYDGQGKDGKRFLTGLNLS
jgi:hypothetical protein